MSDPSNVPHFSRRYLAAVAAVCALCSFTGGGFMSRLLLLADAYAASARQLRRRRSVSERLMVG